MSEERFIRDAKAKGLIVDGRIRLSEDDLSFFNWVFLEWIPTFKSLGSLVMVVLSVCAACFSHCVPLFFSVLIATGKAWLWVLGSLLVAQHFSLLPATLQEVSQKDVQDAYGFHGIRSMLYHQIATILLCAVAAFMWSVVLDETLGAWAKSSPPWVALILVAATLFALVESIDSIKTKIDRSLSQALIARTLITPDPTAGAVSEQAGTQGTDFNNGDEG